MPVTDPLYPVHLRLAGRRCLVVGGGGVALGKARGLLEAKALLDVVAPEFAEGFSALEGARLHARPYRPGEAAGYRLVIAATDDARVNRQVFEDGEAAGVWVNSADDPENCGFILPARVRQGDLLVTVGTAGRSPALASWVRSRLEAEFGPEYQTLLDLLSDAREELRSRGVATEGLAWQEALDSGMLLLIREGNLAEAKERLEACLSSSSA